MDTIIGLLIGAVITLVATIIIEKYKNEMQYAKTTYEKYLDKVLSYYSTIYWFYRLCSDVVNYSVIKYPDGKNIFSRKVYMDNLDKFVEEYNNYRGYIRLLLPEKLLQVDNELLIAFNNYRDEITAKEIPDKTTIDVFNVLHLKKNLFETELREYLRTEKLLK